MTFVYIVDVLTVIDCIVIVSARAVCAMRKARGERYRDAVKTE